MTAVLHRPVGASRDTSREASLGASLAALLDDGSAWPLPSGAVLGRVGGRPVVVHRGGAGVAAAVAIALIERCPVIGLEPEPGGEEAVLRASGLVPQIFIVDGPVTPVAALADVVLAGPDTPEQARRVVAGLGGAGGEPVEIHSWWAPGVVTTLGAPARLTVRELDAAGADKAVRFMRMCGAFGLPLVVEGALESSDPWAAARMRKEAGSWCPARP